MTRRESRDGALGQSDIEPSHELLLVVSHGEVGGCIKLVMMTPIGEPLQTERSWAAVYEAHAARLTRMATMLVGPADAHDLVADAVMASVTSPGWSQVEEPGAYLPTALVCAAAAVHRSTGARLRREERVARSMPRVSLNAASDDEIRRAVDHLSATQAAIVCLLYWDRVPGETGIGADHGSATSGS